MTPQEFGALVKRAQNDQLTPMEKEAFRGALAMLGRAPAAAARLGRAFMSGLRGAPAAAGAAARSSAMGAIPDAAVAGGARAVTDMGVKGLNTALNAVGPAVGNTLAGIGGAMMYPVGFAAEKVLAPAIRHGGYLASNVLAAAPQLAGKMLRGGAFSKNPIARTVQTLTGAAGVGGAAGYGVTRSYQDRK